MRRREFLKLAARLAGLTAGLVVAGCRPTGLPLDAAPAGAATRPPQTRVAIARARTYDRREIRQQVEALIENLDGLGKAFKPGSRVALKVNLTSGAHFQPPPGLTAPESYVTHPEVVQALGELLIDAGVRQLFLVEAVYDADSAARWGYDDVARHLSAALVDLNAPDPYPDFASIPVPGGGSIYESFLVNPILTEVDALISVAKLKCHYNCGVTLSMKNRIGLLPVSRYRLSPDHWWRSALHGTDEDTGTRLSGVILDLHRAFPLGLALVDGVLSAEGGEVPRGSFRPLQPGVLLAGRDPVAVDAVAAAVMGFDPLAEPPQPPFLRGPNYLTMAHRAGLGTNDRTEIEVAGLAIDEVQVPFEPAWEMGP